MEEQKQKFYSKGWFKSLVAFVIIFGTLGSFLFWTYSRNIVGIENSYIDAPVVNVTPVTPGNLNAIYVKDGDKVTADAQVALIGSDVLYARENGVVSMAPQVTGSFYQLGQTVVSIIATDQMRVVGQIDENKGLDKIQVGQKATFTADAFPGKTYEGTVDEISENSNDTSVVFSISDKRPTRTFNVYVRFDPNNYPELKKGMSAKIKVYTRT